MRIVKIKYQLVTWIFYLLLILISNYFSLPNQPFKPLNIVPAIINIIFIAIYFYFVLEILLPLVSHRNKIVSMLYFTGSILLLSFIHALLQKAIYSYFLYPSLRKITINIHLICFYAFNYCQVIPWAFVYWYVKKNILEEQQKDVIQQQNNQLQQKIIKTQLQALKTKINPDFLDETLEFFQKQAQNSSKELSKAIELLAQMLNYAIKEDDGHGKVDLAKEVIHIQNFIQIQQLRFSNRLNVQFQINGSLHNIQIVPLILITFVENAFKHGALENHENPLNINLTINNKQLSFYTQNIPRKGPLENAQGIGLANTKKRLQLAYPNKHNLIITQDDKTYQLQLNIKL